MSDRFKRTVARVIKQTTIGDVPIQRLTVHRLRRTHAVVALERGVDIKTLRSMLGHASVAFTLDVYAAFVPEARRGRCEGDSDRHLILPDVHVLSTGGGRARHCLRDPRQQRGSARKRLANERGRRHGERDGSMTCPRCGGASRRQISGGFWECTTSHEIVTNTVRQVGPEVFQPAVRSEFRTCHHRYHEGDEAVSSDPALCRCNTFAIGQCTECGVPVCGDHSDLWDEHRVCLDHLAYFIEIRLAERTQAEEKRRSATNEWQRDRRGQITRCIEALRAAGSPGAVVFLDKMRGAPTERGWYISGPMYFPADNSYSKGSFARWVVLETGKFTVATTMKLVGAGRTRDILGDDAGRAAAEKALRKSIRRRPEQVPYLFGTRRFDDLRGGSTPIARRNGNFLSQVRDPEAPDAIAALDKLLRDYNIALPGEAV